MLYKHFIHDSSKLHKEYAFYNLAMHLRCVKPSLLKILSKFSPHVLTGSPLLALSKQLTNTEIQHSRTTMDLP